MKKLLFFLWLSLSLSAFAQPDSTTLVAYLGGNERVELFDVFQLRKPGHLLDSTYLVAGGAANLNWLTSAILPINQRTELGLTSSQGQTLLSDSGGVGFLLHFSKDMKTILHCVHFPQGKGTTINRIRTTTRTGDPTGELYISGRRFVSDSGYVTRNRFGLSQTFPKDEYFIARLNGNFFNQVPSAAIFYVNARARYDYRNDNIHTYAQPWDVNTHGEVVYGEGATYIPVFNSFCYLRKVDAWGRPMVVPGWMMHMLDNGQIVYGNPAPPNTQYSMINGYMGKRGSWRSHNPADFAFASTDANGNPRTGRYPDDFWYKAPVDPNTGAGEPSDLETGPGFTTGLSAGPGRTGRVADHPRSYGFGSIVFDKVTNNLYVGFTVGYYWQKPADTTSKTAWDARHEFDPQVVAMDTNGFILNWDRMKKEASNDQPDSYLDALDIDYANRMLVIVARQHGNDYNTSWVGNDLVANPSAAGFKNGLNGTTGDIHIQWIGKYRLSDFKVVHSTFLAEYPVNAPIQTPYTQPLYDGWQNQNADFISLANTRKISEACNMMKVGRDGKVAITVQGSRIMTTSNAWQKMAKPPLAGGAAVFQRVYSPDLRDVVYSSLLTVPIYSTSIQTYGLLPLNDRILSAGAGGTVVTMAQVKPPGTNWNFSVTTAPANPAGILASLPYSPTTFPEPQDTLTYPLIPVVPPVSVRSSSVRFPEIRVFPNPVGDVLHVDGPEGMQKLRLINAFGQILEEKQVLPGQQHVLWKLSTRPSGIFWLSVLGNQDTKTIRLVARP